MTNKYFNFLRDIVIRTKDYDRLLESLHNLTFYSLVPNDDNRGADGEQLRNDFVDEVGPQGSSSLPDGPCTMLEMLIGLSYRLEFELLGGCYERPACDWFWVLIDNLELSSYTDKKMNYGGYGIEIDTIIRDLLERKYDPDGNGGLFPLKHSNKDQRQVEIWYQMSAWIIENYPI